MKRERIDKRMILEVTNRVLYPFYRDLGARDQTLWDVPGIGGYDHENKTLSVELGRKHHGDKRHRNGAKCVGITYTDGQKIEGPTTTVEIDQHIGWSRRLDNRLVANKVTVSEKIMSFEESFNKLRSLSSLDIMHSLSASAQGEIAGIGGSVTQTSRVSAHTEVETEKMNHTKKERIIDDTTVLDYPGPVLYDADEFDDDSVLLHRKGSIQYEGEIWLIERPVLTLQTTTPVTQWGIWDCARLELNIYDWAGDYAPYLPSGEHKNVLVLAGLSELLDLMKGNLPLQYKWSSRYKPSHATREGMAWLEDAENRRVGPVEWDRVRLIEDVAALEPSIVTE